MINKIKKILGKKYLFNFYVILSLNFLTFFLELISLGSIPVFVGFVIDSKRLIGKIEEFGFYYFSNLENIETIKYAGILIILIFLIKNIFLLILIYIQAQFFKNFKLELSSRLLNFYIYSPFSFYTQSNPATLTRNSVETIEGVGDFLLNIINLFRESLTIAVIFTLLIFVNAEATILIAFFFTTISYLYFKKIRPIIKVKSETNESIKVKLIQMINESFAAIKDIKILNKEKEILKNYNYNRNLLERNIFHFTHFKMMPKLLLETVAIFVITLSTLVIFQFNNEILSLLSILTLIVIAVVRFIPAFNSIITSLTYLRLYTPSLKIISEEISKMNNLKKITNKKDKLFTEKFNLNYKKHFLMVKNVSFSFNKNINILKNVSFNLEKGSKTGITGITGSGKSTLFHIMLGLLQPNTGNIFFKGKSIFANLSSWRNQIGYIAQNIYLLDNTIEKNISFEFFDNKIDTKKIAFAIEMSELKDKISSLPMGLQTKVGNDGVKLSGGEKQRIAIARSIYRNPDIIFMDESTSSLDLKTEKTIMSNIYKNFSTKTIILIAHRESAINRCDKVIHLENGNISYK